MVIQFNYLKVNHIPFIIFNNVFIGIIKPDKLRALAGGDPNALKLYVVATLFRNFHVWLYGSQSSNYFDISYNNPEEILMKYINKEDLK